MIKSNLKLIIAMGVIALGLATTNAFAQAAGGGRAGRGGAAGGGAGPGAGGMGGRGGATITVDAIKTAIPDLTADQIAKITPIVDAIAKAQAEAAAAQTKFNDTRVAEVAKITALLTDAQKPLLDTVVNARGGRGGAGAGAGAAGGAAGGRGGRGGRGGAAGGAAPAAPAPAAPAPAA